MPAWAFLRYRTIDIDMKKDLVRIWKDNQRIVTLEKNNNMGLPINIDKLLRGNVVEWERIDFKKGWNPEDVLHSICAFANDMHNWGGGYIVVGVEENNGTPILPPCGVDIKSVDGIQKELMNVMHKIEPVPIVIPEPVQYMRKTILILWIPG